MKKLLMARFAQVLQHAAATTTTNLQLQTK